MNGRIHRRAFLILVLAILVAVLYLRRAHPVRLHPRLVSASIPNLWDTAWILPLSDQATVDSYIEARASQGFNAMMVGVASWGLQNTALGNGQTPFLANDVSVTRTGTGRWVADVSQPNNAGFAYIDHIVRQAEANNITVGLLPMSNGNTDTYVAAFTDTYSGEKRAYNYGKYVGQRYRNYSNIIWVLGGDVDPGASSTVVPLTRSLARGIRDSGATQAMTFHPTAFSTGEGESSSQWFKNDRWLTFNMIQQPNTRLISSMVRSDYALRKRTGLGEGAYEGSVGADVVRSEAYQVYLCGGSYLAYGQANNYAGQNAQDTPGIDYSRIARNLMVQRGWLNYVPDNGRFVTSHGGTVIASVKGNTAAMVYILGSNSSATLNLSRVNSGSSVHVERFNPGDGTKTSLGSFVPSGTQQFDTGGLPDAVILFDAVSSNSATY